MRAHEDLWHPTRTLTRWLVALLVVQATVQAAQIGQGTPRSFDRLANALNALFAGHNALARSRFKHLSDGSSFTFWQLVGYLSIAFIVLVIIWQWRSQTNASALGRTGARFSPGWGIAGWLIPVANYVIPYLVFQDLWRSSDAASAPGTEWRSRPGSPLVSSWWIAYVIGTITPLVAMMLVLATSVSAADTDSFVNAAHAVLAAASVLGIFVVRGINERQELQQAATPAPTTPSFVLERGFGSGGPGWYPDPLARFEHRYWDGHIWTEWVSTKGQLAIDTEPVSGYD
jgi:Domain of unknown function (DUF4328)/Protein of unknown function (DUF2510)